MIVKNRKTAAKNCKNCKPPRYNRPPIISHGKSFLQLSDDSARIIDLEDEIILWRAHLRNSEYPYDIWSRLGSLADLLYKYSAGKTSKSIFIWHEPYLQNMIYTNVNLLGEDDEISPYVYCEDESW